MNAKHHRLVLELFNCSDEERRERIERLLTLYPDMSVDEVTAVAEEIFFGNDVEGAALEVAALDLTFSDPDDALYYTAANRIMSEHCPLLRLYFDEPDFPDQLEFKVEEMIGIVFDGAERIGAGIPSVV